MEFWLANRQISGIVSLVKCVHNRCPNLIPIYKELMRGASGWISPEILKPKEGCERVLYKTGEEALEIIRKTYPDFDNDS